MSASIIPTKSVSSTIPSSSAVLPSVEASQIVDPTVISLENPLVIVGIVGAVVLFILFVSVLYYMKRRRRRKTNVLENMESSPHTRAGESSENPMKTVKPYIFERKSSLRKKRPPSSSNTRSSVVGAKSYIPQKRQESKMEALPPRRQIDPLIAAEYEQHFNIHSAASNNRDSFSTVSTPESLILQSNDEDTITATRNSFVANIESSFNRRQNLILEKEKETAKEDETVADGEDDIVSDVFDQYALPTNTYNEGIVSDFVQFNETAAIPGLPEINIIASTPSPAHSYLSSVEQSSWYNYQSVENPYDGEFDDLEPNNDMVDDDFEYFHDTDSMSDSDSEGSSMKSNEEIEEVEETEIAPTVERPIPELISESLASNAPEYIVIKEYEPLLAKELHLQKGDKIAVIEVYENNGMAYGVNRDTKEVGFFPVSCLELDIEGSE